jgi:quercetin dioxygenase-like cupin family protein
MTSSGSIRPGRRFENPVIGDVATFPETSEESGGERTLLEIDLRPGGGNPPHYHKTYTERFRVLAGRLTVQVDGAEFDLGPGEEAEAPPGSRHFFTNSSSERTVFQIEFRPGHSGFEKSLQIGYGLAADGRTNKKSIPKNPLHTALLLEWGEMRLPGAYTLLERPMRLLARIARRRGVDRKLEGRYLNPPP